MPAEPARMMTVVDESLIHEGHNYHFAELTVQYKDGVVRTKPMVRHNGAATILPLLETPEGIRVVMIRNERVTVDQFLLELPAGGIDQGEVPQVAAGRELVEETGYKASSVELLCTFLTTPGLTDERMHVFVARDLQHVGQKLEPYESLSVELHDPKSVIEMIDRNEIVDGKTMLTIKMAQGKGIL
jgi:ADP-ribose pyrophosphatase